MEKNNDRDITTHNLNDKVTKDKENITNKKGRENNSKNNSKHNSKNASTNKNDDLTDTVELNQDLQTNSAITCTEVTKGSKAKETNKCR